MTLEKLSKLANVALFSGQFLALTAFFYVSFIEDPYLSYGKGAFQVVGDQFRPGDLVPLKVERCNRDSVPHSYYLAHSVLNTETLLTYLMPEEYVRVDPGCRTAISYIHKLPNDIEPGRYIIFGGAQVRGTIRTFDVTWESKPFGVIRR